MKCKECGTLIPDIARFCFNCGVPIEKEAEKTSTDDNKEKETTSKEAESKKEVNEEEKPEKKEEKPEKKEENKENKKPEKSEDKKVDKKEEKDKEDKEDKEDKKPSQAPSDDDVEDVEEEEEQTSKGYAIMVNPDYVPPEVEEIVPLFEEHFDYQSVHKEKMEKLEKVITRVGYAVGGLVLVAVVGFFGVKFYYAHEYKSLISEGDTMYDGGNYTAAIASYNQALNVKGADKKAVAEKIVKTYEAEDRYDLAYRDVLDIYNEVAKENGGDADLYAEVVRLKGLAEDSKEDSKEDGKKDDSKDDKKDDVKPTVAPDKTETPDKPEVPETPEDKEEPQAPTQSYDDVLAQIKEASMNRDFDTIISKYEEAVAADAKRAETYIYVASAYAAKNDLENAKKVAKEGIKAAPDNSATLEKKLAEYESAAEGTDEPDDVEPNDNAKDDKEIANACESIMNSLDEMMSRSMVDGAVKRLLTDNFTQICETSDATYYTADAGVVDSIKSGKGMAIYGTKFAYYGDFSKGKRSGKGMLIAVSQKEDGSISYYVYSGDWKNDLPNGSGSIKSVSNYGADDATTSIISGTFKNGYASGKMTKLSIVKGENKGKSEFDGDENTSVKGLELK